MAWMADFAFGMAKYLQSQGSTDLAGSMYWIRARFCLGLESEGESSAMLIAEGAILNFGLLMGLRSFLGRISKVCKMKKLQGSFVFMTLVQLSAYAGMENQDRGENAHLSNRLNFYEC